MGSETIRRHQQVPQDWCHETLVSKLNLLNDPMRGRLGILIFSSFQKRLHTDRQVLELLGRLDEPECAIAFATHVAPVCELRDTIQATMDHRRAAGIWESFELKRVFFEPTRKIVARGFGLVDRNSSNDSYIAIVLEELPLRPKHSEPQAPTLRWFQDKDGMATRGSAQLGSAHGVFDVTMRGAR